MTREASRDATLTPTRASDTLPAAPPGHAPAAAGSYELGELLGRGGMGDVILAHDPKMGREVALKRMRMAQPTEEAIDRFLREAKIQARLDHPAIVPVHDLGYDSEGLPYFTMKRLAGTTLAALLESGTAPIQQMLRAFVDVCLAVELAHTRRIIHRDLKPSNIMLGDYGEVYVLDWGIARVLADPETSDRTREPIPSLDGHTKVGQLLGTPGYMAPEQVRGDEVGPPADVYALGSILFEILTGQPLHPRGAGALVSTLEGSADGSPARRDPARGIAPELDAACAAALAVELTARPTARALADKVQRYLDGDRDLEQRRTLADAQLGLARAALASGDPARRGEAVLAAGRALAFAPGSTEALALVTSMIVDVPRELPRELVETVKAEEAKQQRLRSKRAVTPFLMLFLVVPPFIPFLDVASWPLLIALMLAALAIAGLSLVNWKVRAVPIGVFLAVQLAFILLFSRLTGPFIITPMLIAGMLLAFTSVPWLNDRKWAVIAWTLVAVMLPLGLEWAGVLASTWHMTPQGLVMHGTVFDSRTWIDALMFVIGNAAIAVTLGIYGLGFARDRRQAQRELYIQAWHLRQLLPPPVVEPGPSPGS